MRLASILAAGVAALAAIGGVAFAQTDPGNTGIAVELMPLPGPRPLSAQQIADLFQLRKSEGRAKSLQSAVGTDVAVALPSEPPFTLM